MNQVTHYLDLSNVYGLNGSDALRTCLVLDHEQILLPPDEKSQQDCTLSKSVTGVEPPKDVKCFKAGIFNTAYICQVN